MSLSWPDALTWRLRQHLLAPVGEQPVVEVVRRLGAVPTGGDAELSIRLRCQRSHPGEVTEALADGRLIRTFAFRGATHLLTPEEGADYLALRAASRMWARRSWQTHYGLAPEDWPAFRAAVAEALADGPLTREELGSAVTAHPAYAHLGFAFADDALTLLKPLAWHGALAFGPLREGRTTFQGLADNPRWQGIPDVEEAGPRAVAAYVRAYGPTTADHLHYWLGSGLGAGRTRVQGWLAGLEDRLATVEVEGQPALVLAEDHDDLVATTATGTVRLLPGYDQWVLGPGTADPHVVPPHRRQPVSRGADVVLADGVVAGTWAVRGDEVVTEWFDEAGAAPVDSVDAEVARLSGLLGRALGSSLRTTPPGSAG